MKVDASDGALPVEPKNHTETSTRTIRVSTTLAERPDWLEFMNADMADVLSALSQEMADEGSVEDPDQNNGRFREPAGRARRWGPTLADVLTYRD